MIQTVKGDIFESDVDIIVHQVNCCGTMGAGIAKQIRNRFPNTFANYRKLCESTRPEHLIGHNLYTAEMLDERRVIVANIFGQNGFGRSRLFTDYDALNQCFARLAKDALSLKTRGLPNKIGIPYKIGCGLGGGDWSIVSEIISCHLSDLDVTIYKLK